MQPLESPHFFRQILACTHEGVIVLDRDLRHVVWNRLLEEWSGLSLEQVRGKRPWEIVPALKELGVVEALEHALAGHGSTLPDQAFQWPRRPDPAWISASFNPLRNEAGEVAGVVVLLRDVTERRQAEEAQAASELRLTSALSAGGMGTWTWDLATNLVHGDNFVRGVFGFEPTGPRERPVAQYLDRVLAEDLPAVQAAIQEARDSHGSVAVEFRVRKPGGPVRWLESRWRVESEPEGPALRFHGSLSDITAHKRLALGLQRLNRVHAVTSDINESILREPDPGAMLSAACTIAVERGRFPLAWIGLLDHATGHLAITAHAGADATTLDIIGQLVATDPPAGCAFTQHALRTGRRGVCNDVAQDPAAVAWRDAALQRGYLAMAAFPLLSDEQVIGAFNVYADEAGFFDADELRLLDELAQDISLGLDLHRRERQRLASEQALRESEERFRQLAENIREVFWMTDPTKQRMLYISPAYESIWGRSCESLYREPRTWIEAIHPEDRPRVLAAIEARQERGDYDETYRIVRPDGTVRWIHDRAYPLNNAEGVVYRIVGTAEDITAQRQLEEQYRQAQKMEAIGQLAGGVAHDFNNLLTAISGYADLLREEWPEDHAGREDLQEIVNAADRAATLTRQLLAFSRRQVILPQLLDLNDSVTSLAKMLQRILGEDVHMRLDLHSRPLMTRADPGMVDQLLMNLVVNARDAMPGGGQLTIETAETEVAEPAGRAAGEAAPGRYVVLRVTDTGTGIAPEHLPHILEPFFTTKAPGKGTGLGLATVYGIVQQHGGSLRVDSQPGQGATFEILLPAAGAAEAAPRRDTPRSHPVMGAETVLVVEDDAAVRGLMMALLTRHGYRALEAATGGEALALWEKQSDPVHLLMTDIIMPGGMDGRELARQLRERCPDLKVLFTSGYSASIAGRELTLPSGQHFIQKPSTPRRLLEAVRRCLES